MKWFYNMRIGAKLIVAFILVAFIAGIVGAVGVVQIRTIDKDYNELYEGYGVPLGYLLKISEGYHMRRGLLKDLIIQVDAETEQKTVNRIKEVDKVIIDNMALYEATITIEEDRVVYVTLSNIFGKYDPIKEEFINYALEEENDKAMALMSGTGAEITKEVEAAIDNIIKLNIDTGRQLSNDYSIKTKNTVFMMIAIVIGAMGIAVLLGSVISRLISKPLSQIVKGAEKIADGDLDVALDINTKDEVGILAAAFIKMTNNLNDAMTNINSAAEQVASGSRQVSDSSIALSQGATEQASSVEQLTAALEEISAQTKQNAENANEANLLAETAKANAAQGNSQMTEMLKAMDEINDSSSNISKIIKVIDEIAFQTNILALNAAVEAARAGQHGKGFAVVAEEVRNLAARSANAAKETTDMIEGSIKKVEGGTRIANQTADALSKIVEGVTKVASLVGDIAKASNEQASGIAQINQGIMQVSEVVQTNSATSEESAAASEELSGQAEMLKEEAARFKLKKMNRSISYRGTEEISTDVLRMLDNMNSRKKAAYMNEVYEEAAATSSKKIALSDKEFGKY